MQTYRLDYDSMNQRKKEHPMERKQPRWALGVGAVRSSTAWPGLEASRVIPKQGQRRGVEPNVPNLGRRDVSFSRGRAGKKIKLKEVADMRGGG